MCHGSKKLVPNPCARIQTPRPNILTELPRTPATPWRLFGHHRAALLGCNHPSSKSAPMWSEASKKLYGCMSAKLELARPAAVGCVGSGAIRDDDLVLAL